MNFLILAVCVISFSQHLNAQKDSSGIYKTVEDYQYRRLSYAINYKTEKHKIKDNLLFNQDKIIVKHKGEKITMLKSDVYGYRDTKGVEYRFINNIEYKVLNPGESIPIYLYQHLAHSAKDVSQGLYPPQYYFSKDAVSCLEVLTKDNLKAAFPNNHRFHDELDSQIRSDRDLYSYDDFHRMYKINWLLKNSSN